MGIECQHCFGTSDDCDGCERGRVFCEECLRDGWSERAVEALDYSEDGGPRVWPVCAMHGRQLKERRQRMAAREEI